ncbi:MAG: toprim domain-containing protein [Eggerthia catenaformis]|uniref:toprim domain-containing protein n=1 Tax=Eggerthia catenaformis TaxID=31973 RepID=UPI003FA10963
MNANDYQILKESKQLNNKQKQEIESLVSNYSILKICDELGIDYESSNKTGQIYHLVDHDSCIIWTEANVFKRYSGLGKVTRGNAVSFLMAFGQEYTGNKFFNSYDYALIFLKNHFDKTKLLSPLPSSQSKKTDKLLLPLPARDNSQAIDYLVNERKIDMDIVLHWIKNKNLYEGIKTINTKTGKQFESHNCVFVSYDKQGKPIFGIQRGIYTSKDGKTFKQDVEGSNYDYNFNIRSNKSENPTLIVCEAVIDMLSIMSLYKDSEYYKNANYHSLNGTDKVDGLINTIKTNKNITDVMLCLDNDNAGRHATSYIKEKIKEMNRHILITTHFPPTPGVDWNNELLMGFNPKWQSQLINYMKSKKMNAEDYEKLDERTKKEIQQIWMYPTQTKGLGLKR